MDGEREVGERLYYAVSLTEGKVFPQLFQAAKFPRHWQQSLVVKVQYVGLLSVKKHFLEFKQLLVDLEVGFRPMTADLEADGVRVVFDATQQCVLKLPGRLWIGPNVQRLKGEK